jgi:hypothetical protein
MPVNPEKCAQNEDLHEQLRQAALACRSYSAKKKPDSDNAEAKRERRRKLEQIIKNIAGIMEEMEKAEVPEEMIDPQMPVDEAVKGLKKKMTTFTEVLRENLEHTPQEGQKDLSVTIQKVAYVIDQQIKANAKHGQDGNPGSARVDEARGVQPASGSAQELPVVPAALFQPDPAAAQDPPVVLAVPVLPDPSLPIGNVLSFEQAKALQEKRRAQEAKPAQKEAGPAPIQTEKALVNQGKKRAISNIQADLVAPVQGEEALKKRAVSNTDMAKPVNAEQGMPGPALPADQAVPGNADQVAPAVAQDIVIDLTGSD